jgi:hypothetical protein
MSNGRKSTLFPSSLRKLSLGTEGPVTILHRCSEEHSMRFKMIASMLVLALLSCKHMCSLG